MALSESSFKPLVAGNQKPLFQCFSAAPPVQALRGLPGLGSLSVVQLIRHIEGPPSPPPPIAAGVLLCRLVHPTLTGAPWMESCSVVQCLWLFIGQALCCLAANAGMWGERGYSDDSTSYA